MDARALRVCTVFSFRPEDACGIMVAMIRKTVTKGALNKTSETQQNLRYWASKSPEDRLAAVDYLRKQLYGDSARFQRTARVVQRSQR